MTARISQPALHATFIERIDWPHGGGGGCFLASTGRLPGAMNQEATSSLRFQLIVCSDWPHRGGDGCFLASTRRLPGTMNHGVTSSLRTAHRPVIGGHWGGGYLSLVAPFPDSVRFRIVDCTMLCARRGSMTYLFITSRRPYTGCPKNNGTVNFQDFALINSYLFSPCWIEHLFLFIITPRSFNLVKNYLFYE